MLYYNIPRGNLGRLGGPPPTDPYGYDPHRPAATAQLAR